MVLKENLEMISRPERFADDIYAEAIRKNDTIVIVGASYSVVEDPTSLMASYLTGREGLVYLADPLFYGLPAENAAPRQGGQIHREGGVNSLMKQIKALRAFGLPLSEVRWLGFESGLFSLPLPAESVDVVIEHYTSSYISRREHAHHKEFDLPAFFEKVFLEYSKALKSQGRVILQTDLETAPFLGQTPKNLKEIIIANMKKAGISGNFQKAADKYGLPITRWQFKQLIRHRLSSQNEESRAELVVRKGISSPELIFEKPYWESPDLFLGTKS